MAHLLHPNGDEETILPPISLKKAQELIGGYVELARPAGHDVLLLMDDEGLIKKLPQNLPVLAQYGFSCVGKALVLNRQEAHDFFRSEA